MLRLNWQLVIKIIAFFLLVLLLGGIEMLYPGFYYTVWHLVVQGDIAGTIDFLRSFGVSAMVVSFLLLVLINALGFLPNIFLLAANGVVFGIAMGSIISWLGECVGAVLGFIAMRHLFRDCMEQVIKGNDYLKKMDDLSASGGFKAVLFARAMPYFPAGLITAAGALSSMSLWDYSLATFIGKLPSTILEVMAGHDMILYKRHMHRLVAIVVGTAALYGAYWWYKRQKSSKEQ